MKVLFCSSEVAPFAKTGGLADVCGSLPLALEKIGIEVSIVMPHYQCVDAKRFKLQKASDGVFAATIGRGINVYFIENKSLYDRDGLYGDKKGDYKDNIERFSYFCRESLHLLKKLSLKVDIIHCHDWHAALMPVYLKTLYKHDKFFAKLKSVLTIHNLAYQGIFPAQEFPKLDLPKELFGINGLEFYERINLLKGGIIFADRVTTVSPQYAQEIQGHRFGFGLDGVLRHKNHPVVGILNGLDYDVWDPAKDALIPKQYSAKTFKEKYANKAKLQENSGLKRTKDVPIFGFVGRLASQKGLDLIAAAMDEMAAMDLQIAFLGVGDEAYQKMLRKAVKKYPKKIAAFLTHDESSAHLVYAGSDILLMPSNFEPCGLSQMISLKYGTIPLVFHTGGLADTIKPIHAMSDDGNGFVFTEYTKKAFLDTVAKAVKTFQHKRTFDQLVKKAFAYDFSWDKSALQYQKTYTQCLS